jgi:hypothetical protein
MSTTPLILKNPRGWFAAGTEVERALERLSDGAFKLFVYICLNAQRDTGLLEMSQTRLARNLKKGNGTIRRYLTEMETAGMCRTHFDRSPNGRGFVRIDPAHWPYRVVTEGTADDEAGAYVLSVRKMLEARACIRSSFSTADEILARQWHERGVSLERIERAILMGCARKYVSWRNNQCGTPIGSLKYFEPILEELAESKTVDPDYWEYLRSRIGRMEKLWIESHQPSRDGDPLKLADEETGKDTERRAGRAGELGPS